MKHQIILTAILTIALLSCGGEDEKDMQKPEIQIGYPHNCAELQRGERYTFRAQFTDNIELGSYNIEIHHNFDHHSHSTDSEECESDAAKTPVNAWVFNQDYAIPAGSRTYTANVEITVPADIDAGDYHFMVRLTDRSGWQQLAAKSIKIRK
ncbi:MAG: DUF4625 domain-containing protein [Dysgonamonadaceae bacterium]|jgi:hypothetical protein|nr:DUF4625 domain-containing protein [Dysgonamonadaceae bacterium]